MSIKQSFVCDNCGKEFTSRDGKGNPNVIGGVRGVYKEGEGFKQIDADYCDECWAKLLTIIFNNLKK